MAKPLLEFMIDVPSSADVHSAVAVNGGGGTPQQVRQLRHAHGAGVRLNALKLWLLIKPLVQKDHTYARIGFLTVECLL